MYNADRDDLITGKRLSYKEQLSTSKADTAKLYRFHLEMDAIRDGTMARLYPFIYTTLYN